MCGGGGEPPPPAVSCSAQLIIIWCPSDGVGLTMKPRNRSLGFMEGLVRYAMQPWNHETMVSRFHGFAHSHSMKPWNHRFRHAICNKTCLPTRPTYFLELSLFQTNWSKYNFAKRKTTIRKCLVERLPTPPMFVFPRVTLFAVLLQPNETTKLWSAPFMIFSDNQKS